MEKKQTTILSLGIESTVVNFLSREVPECQINPQPYDFKFFETPVAPEPVAIFCGQPPPDLQAAEVAQSLRMIYPSTPIFFVSITRQNFNRKLLMKNGFTDAFLLPADQAIFTDSIKKLLASIGEIRSYRNVRLVDIASDSVLGFDLYLHMPANNKYVKYAPATAALDAERSKRLKEFHVSEAAVPLDQVNKFYQFTAKQLKRMGSSTNISETERRELRERAVRDLFTGIFGESGKDDTLAQGRQVMTDCQEIIKCYVLDENASAGSWIEKIMKISNASDGTYDRSTNISTYASLFSIGSGIGQPEELAMAGLLHDIGLADIPVEISMKPESERSPEEIETYRKHPLLSVNMLKEKKLILSEKVMKIIAQHHERFDGRGFPEAVPGNRLLKEAQILSIADLFNDLTSVKPGLPRKTPQEAMQEILEMNSRPGSMIYDPALLQQIAALFPKKNKAA